MTTTVRLVLHYGQQMIDVLDDDDIGGRVYWDAHEWHADANDIPTAQIVKAMNRLKVHPSDMAGQR